MSNCLIYFNNFILYLLCVNGAGIFLKTFSDVHGSEFRLAIRSRGSHLRNTHRYSGKYAQSSSILKP